MGIDLLAPAAWFLTFVVHATLLLGLVWLLRGRVERLEPKRRVVALRWALGGALLTATLQRAVPLPKLGSALGFGAREGALVDVERQQDGVDALRAADAALLSARDALAVGQASTAAAPRTAQLDLRRLDSGSRLASDVLEGSRPASFIEAETSGTTPAAVRRVVPVPASVASLSGLLLVLGFVSSCLALLRSVRLERSLGQRIEVDPDSTLGRGFSALQAEARASGSRVGRTRLTTSASLCVPIAYGAFRPQVVLPERALEECSAAELEAAMAHELAHIARGDLGWAAFDLLNRCLLCFHPLARFAADRLEAAQESAADALGATWTRRPKAMASMLARAAAWVLEARSMHAPKLQSAMAVRGHALTRRVEALLAPEPAPRGSLKIDRWLPAMACALAFLPPLAPARAANRPTSVDPRAAHLAASVGPARTSDRSATDAARTPPLRTRRAAVEAEPDLPERRAGLDLDADLSRDPAAEPAPPSTRSVASNAETSAFLLQLGNELRTEAQLLRDELALIAELGLRQERVDTYERALELQARAAEIEQLLERFGALLAAGASPAASELPARDEFFVPANTPPPASTEAPESLLPTIDSPR